MASFVTNEYKLDITPQGNYPVVYLSQFENGRQIKFIMMNRGQTFTIPPSGISVTISGVKSNGGYYEHICTFDSRNVYVPVENDMTDVSGRGVATIKFTDVDGDTVVSAKFVMNVQEATSDSGIEVPTVAETILQQILSEIRQEASKLDIDMDELDAKIETFKATVNNNYSVFTEGINGDFDSFKSDINERIDNFLASQAGVSHGILVQSDTLYTKPSDNSQSSWSQYIELSEDPRDYDYLILTYGAREGSEYFWDYGNRIITPNELVDTIYDPGPAGAGVKLLEMTFTGNLYKNVDTSQSFTPQTMNQYRLEIYRVPESYTRYRVMNTASWWSGNSSAAAIGWFDSYVAEAAISKVVGIKFVPAGTDKDGELADIRVGANGVTYTSAGEAVRSQFIEANNILNVLATDIAIGAIAHFVDGADNIQIKSLKVDIEPVQSGSGDPSPDNVRPISGWGSVKVMRSGKNLWNPSNVFTGFINNITNTIQVNSVSKICYIRAKPNTTYTVSKMVGERFSVACSDVEPAINAPLYGVILDYTGTSITITTGNSTKYLLAWCYLGSADTATEAEMLASVQFELGSDATEYEPYNGVNVSIDLGRTVYGGTLDVVSGELVIDRRLINLLTSGYTFNLMDAAIYPNNYVYKNYSIGNMLEKNNIGDITKIVCNYLPSIARNNVRVGVFQVHDGNANEVRLSFPKEDRFATWASVQEWMRSLADPFVLCIPLTDSLKTTYNLTPTEVKSLLGINNVWSDAGDVEVEYRADTKLYVDKKIQEALML